MVSCPLSTGRKTALSQSWLTVLLQLQLQATKLNGHDPYAYLTDVLQRLPTQRASAVNELLPHRWVAPTRWDDRTYLQAPTQPDSDPSTE